MLHKVFNEKILIDQLNRMPDAARVVFSLSCATRQMSAIEQYSLRFAPHVYASIKVMIDQLWNALTDASPIKTDWAAALDDVMSLLPEEQDCWAPFHVYADHAISSLAYTIRCLLTLDAQEAAWAARRAYEAADQAAIRDLGVGTGSPDSEAAIRAHPLVQRELGRQERDARILELMPAMHSLGTLKASALREPVLEMDDMSK